MTRLRLRASDTFKSLHTRNFRLFFGGQLISQTGNWMTLVAQALLVLKLTDDGVALGGLAAAQFGPVLLIGPFAGLIADRSDKRKLLMVVQVDRDGAVLRARRARVQRRPARSWRSTRSRSSAASPWRSTTRLGARSSVELVAEEDTANAVSLNSALMTGSRVIGPAIAGFLIVDRRLRLVPSSSTRVSYVFVIEGLRRLDTKALRPSPVAERAKGQVRAGLRYARSVPELCVPLVMMAVVGTLVVQLPDRLPAVRDPRPRRRPVDLHAAVLRCRASARSPARSRARVAQDRRPHGQLLGDGLWRVDWR